MKIIFRGTVPTEKVHKVTCRHCKSQIEFERHEAKYVPDQRDGDFLEVTCPVCSQTITAAT